MYCVYNHYSYLYIAAQDKDLETKRDGLVASFLLTKSQTAKTNANVQVTKPTKVTEIPKSNSSIKLSHSCKLVMDELNYWNIKSILWKKKVKHW
jgi:hypothetical protein